MPSNFFFSMSNRKGKVDLSATSMTEIPANEYQDHTALHEIKLPKSLRTIGSKAFAGCTNLGELHLPDTIQTIADDAFEGCELKLYCSQATYDRVLAQKDFGQNISVEIDNEAAPPPPATFR